MIRKKRFCAFAIDYLLIIVTCYIPFQIIIGFNFNISNEAFYIYIFSAMLLVILKDYVFRNYSFGKKIMKIQIMKKNNQKPSIAVIVLRNVFLLIWPIEAIMFLIFNERLGDIVFNTKVVEMKEI